MIEFKRVGDVMVFECPAFKIEVAGNGAEKIDINREATISDSDVFDRIAHAFKVLDIMLEHKARQDQVLKRGPDITFDVKRSNPGKVVNEIHVKVNVDTEEAEKAIDAMNKKFSGTCMRNYPCPGGF